MLASALAPGSYLVISHLTGDFAPVQVAAATAAYNARVPVPVTARTHSKVTGLFDGLPLLAPGVVPVTEWRPEVGDPFGQPADLHGGVTRIPAGRERYRCPSSRPTRLMDRASWRMATLGSDRDGPRAHAR